MAPFRSAAPRTLCSSSLPGFASRTVCARPYVLDAGNVQPDAMLPGDVHDAVHRAGHVEGGRDTDLGHHLVAPLAPKPRGGVHVQVDDARHHVISADVEQFLGEGRIDIRGNVGDLSASHGDIHDPLALRRRVNHHSVLQQGVVAMRHGRSVLPRLRSLQ